MKKHATKKTASKKPGLKNLATTAPAAKAPTKIVTSKPIAQTDDEKRLARNEALRAWRKANRDKVNAYMRTWKAKKATKETDPAKRKVKPDANGSELRAAIEEKAPS